MTTLVSIRRKLHLPQSPSTSVWVVATCRLRLAIGRWRGVSWRMRVAGLMYRLRWVILLVLLILFILGAPIESVAESDAHFVVLGKVMRQGKIERWQWLREDCLR